MRTLSTVLKTARSITITPISHRPESESRRDYLEEMLREEAGFMVKWDDAERNETRVGDLFAFVQGQGRKETDVGEGICEIRRVVGLQAADDRPNRWTMPQHEHRQILMLSDVVYQGTWLEFVRAMGNQEYGKTYPCGARQLQPQQKTQRKRLP